jgi:quinoprotein relay system zinc metallohydrolase 2
MSAEGIQLAWEKDAPAAYAGRLGLIGFGKTDASGRALSNARPPNCEHPPKPDATVTICHTGKSANHGIANRSGGVPDLPAFRVLACAILLLSAAAAPEPPAPANTPLAVQQVADGDYAHFGQIALATPNNAGDIANLGIIVGQDAVAVVDTGGSVTVGQRLLLAVREITDKPVRYVINTHEHPDHVFGNAAMPPGVTFVGHHNLPAELAKRGAYYLRSYRDQLGEKAISAVRIIPPTLLVDGETTLDLGNRRLRLRAWSPAAHTDCDLTVLDETTGVLFAGDLVFLQHVPVVDGSLTGWLAVIPRLAQVPANIVVPGHGRTTAPWPQALESERRYLTVLAQDTRRLIAAGTPLERAVAEIGSSERSRWQLFDDYNARNATAAFSELEWQ